MKIRNRHNDVVETMAQGMLEMKANNGSEESTFECQIQYFLDRFYLSRISIRMLISQHSQCTFTQHTHAHLTTQSVYLYSAYACSSRNTVSVYWSLLSIRMLISQHSQCLLVFTQHTHAHLATQSVFTGIYSAYACSSRNTVSVYWSLLSIRMLISQHSQCLLVFTQHTHAHLATQSVFTGLYSAYACSSRNTVSVYWYLLSIRMLISQHSQCLLVFTQHTHAHLATQSVLTRILS